MGQTDLLVLGDRVQQLDVQFGVVLGQGFMAVVVDELHHRAEGQRVGETVLPLTVEDLYQLVVASFPADTQPDTSLPVSSGGSHPPEPLLRVE